MRVLRTISLLVLCVLSIPSYAGKKIRNGEVVKKGEFLHVVRFSTRSSKGSTFCTGSLITPEVVVTAAHCIKDRSDLYSWVQVKEAETGRTLRSVRVSHTSKDPRYKIHWLGDDVAFVFLEEPIYIPNYPKLMIKSERKKYLKRGTKITTLGFGRNEHGGFPKALMKITLPIKRVGPKNIVYGNKKFGIAPGDSGGPSYLQLPNGEWRLVGITSFMVDVKIFRRDYLSRADRLDRFWKKTLASESTLERFPRGKIAMNNRSTLDCDFQWLGDKTYRNVFSTFHPQFWIEANCQGEKSIIKVEMPRFHKQLKRKKFSARLSLIRKGASAIDQKLFGGKESIKGKLTVDGDRYQVTSNNGKFEALL